MANLEDDRAKRFRELVIAEHRVCAREHKLLKSMLGDGRCGWYMAAHLLLGDSRKWTQAKKLLVLEGTARSDAVLSHQARVGLPRTETVARKIKFWTDTQRVEIQGGSSADISNLGL